MLLWFYRSKVHILGAESVVLHTGLVCLELLKVIQAKPVEAYRNTFANLALPLFAMAEPIPPKVPAISCTAVCNSNHMVFSSCLAQDLMYALLY